VTDHELLERMDENLAGQRRAIEAIEKTFEGAQAESREFRVELREQRRRSEIFFEQIMARMDALGQETRASTQEILRHTAEAHAWHDDAMDEARAHRAALWAVIDQMRGPPPADA
jgi:hypothetical protein